MDRVWVLALTVMAAQATGPHAARRHAPPASADTWAKAPGPALGAVAPDLELPDQDGRLRRFATLRGPGGLLLNFNRSVVW